MTKIKIWITFYFLVTSAFFANAQNDQLFIYGTVTTIDDETYTGALRWGKEEIFWTDFFNATKTKNENLKDLPDRKDSDLFASESWSSKWMKWGNHGYSSVHMWVCQFGDLKSIEITGRSKIRIELKDGSKMDLGDGSNDVGAKIKVSDDEIGFLELDWNRIEKIEFEKTPSKLESKFGKPLYGTVVTNYGTFEGLVQWDHDERISTDELDGETEDGDFSIKFGKIAYIKNEGNESQVKLLSGRELTLGGTNDVDDGNRGIIVTIDNVGRVDIPWDEFKEVTFDHDKKKFGLAYNDFKEPKPIKGTVISKDGQVASGKIIYDLDEALDLEIIQGMDDEIEYLIPMRYIKQIAPKNYDYAIISLRNGKELLLGEGQDVSDRNDGILVFVKDVEKPKYIKWDDLKEVNFE